MRAFHEQVDVELAEHWAKAVRIFDVVGTLAAIGQQAEAVPEGLLAPRDHAHEESFLADLRQVGEDLSGCGIDNSYLSRLRQEGAHDDLLGRVDELLVHAQYRERVIVIRVNDAVDLRIEHFLCHILIRPVAMQVCCWTHVRIGETASARVPLMARYTFTASGSAESEHGQ